MKIAFSIRAAEQLMDARARAATLINTLPFND
jgi:hypothetical protein